MTSSTAIANYIIVKGRDANISVTNLRLQKLTYIMYGLYLASFPGKKLFTDKVYAWKYGPVIPSIYNSFKNYGKKDIKEEKSTYEDSYDGTIKNEYIPRIPSNIEKEKKLLDYVWESYNDIDCAELVDLTHKEGTPWKATIDWLLKDMPSYIPDKGDFIMLKQPKIKDELIKLYYEKFIKLNQLSFNE